MKIDIDENDKRYVNEINECLAAGEDIPLFISEKGRKYYFEFTCEDVGKANLFAVMLMNPSPEKVKELNENFGITVNAISYKDPAPNVHKIKELLQLLSQELDSI